MTIVKNGIPGMTERLRDRIYDHVFAHPETEVGGVLIGERDAGGPGLAVVRDFIPALEAEGDLVSLTFTHDAWQTIHAEMDDHHPGMEIVGWYHSHPGHGIFLSDHDMFIQQNFFANRSDIAYVIDPQQGLEGVFIWQQDEVVKWFEGPTRRAGATPAAPRKPRRVIREAPRPQTDEPVQRAPSPWARPPAASGGYPLLGYLLPGAIGIMLGLLLALVLAQGDSPAPVAQPASTPTVEATPTPTETEEPTAEPTPDAEEEEAPPVVEEEADPGEPSGPNRDHYEDCLKDLPPAQCAEIYLE